MARGTGRDPCETPMDRAKGWAKETASSLSGNREMKAEGSADQDKGTLKKDAATTF
jgi:uncharacterized protein YjbJ (UPF0337 family)